MNGLTAVQTAYREIAKNADSKSKKSANGSTASKKSISAAGGHASSVSASNKGKGKEKSTLLPPPFTSLPFGVEPGTNTTSDVVDAVEIESMHMDVDGWPEEGDDATQNFEGDVEPDNDEDALDEGGLENEGGGLEEDDDSTEDEQRDARV